MKPLLQSFLIDMVTISLMYINSFWSKDTLALPKFRQENVENKSNKQRKILETISGDLKFNHSLIKWNETVQVIVRRSLVKWPLPVHDSVQDNNVYHIKGETYPEFITPIFTVLF